MSGSMPCRSSTIKVRTRRIIHQDELQGTFKVKATHQPRLWEASGSRFYLFTIFVVQKYKINEQQICKPQKVWVRGGLIGSIHKIYLQSCKVFCKQERPSRGWDQCLPTPINSTNNVTVTKIITLIS